MTWIAAIDFGTSFTAAAVKHNDLPPELKDFGGRARMRSCIGWDTRRHELRIGEDAYNNRIRSWLHLMRTPKRLVDARRVLLEGRDEAVEVVELWTVLLATVFARLRDDEPSAPDEVRMTHPALWVGARLEKLKRATTAALARTGWESTKIVFVPEPVAAALRSIDRAEDVAVGESFAVYDLGGGTFDAAVVRRTPTGFEVIAQGGLDPCGGEDFDERILRGVEKRMEEFARDSDVWKERLKRFRQLVSDDWLVANGTGSGGPNDAELIRGRLVLRDSIVELKEQISRSNHGDLRLDMIEPDFDEQILRDELEQWIVDEIDRSLAVLVATIQTAKRYHQLEDRQLVRVVLAGGSSHLPIVRQRVMQATGLSNERVFSEPDRKGAVALGATVDPPEPPEPEQPTAQEEFERGQALARAGDTAGARAAFQRAIDVGLDGPQDEWARRAAYELGLEISGTDVRPDAHEADAVLTAFAIAAGASDPLVRAKASYALALLAWWRRINQWDKSPAAEYQERMVSYLRNAEADPEVAARAWLASGVFGIGDETTQRASLRKAFDSGDPTVAPKAAFQLAKRLEQDDRDEAVRLYRVVVDHGIESQANEARDAIRRLTQAETTATEQGALVTGVRTADASDGFATRFLLEGVQGGKLAARATHTLVMWGGGHGLLLQPMVIAADKLKAEWQPAGPVSGTDAVYTKQSQGKLQVAGTDLFPASRQLTALYLVAGQRTWWASSDSEQALNRLRFHPSSAMPIPFSVPLAELGWDAHLAVWITPAKSSRGRRVIVRVRPTNATDAADVAAQWTRQTVPPVIPKGATILQRTRTAEIFGAPGIVATYRGVAAHPNGVVAFAVSDGVAVEMWTEGQALPAIKLLRNARLDEEIELLKRCAPRVRQR